MKDDPYRDRWNNFNASRLSERGLDELIGACRGVLADGVINDSESHFLLEWLNANQEVAMRWPADVLYLRIQEMLVDRTLDVEEQGELLELLHGIVGGPVPVADRVASYAATLPLDQPAPEIEFMNRTFVLTGKFASGSRKQCELAVTERGGFVRSAVSPITSFVVVGAFASAAWKHSTFGLKIQNAVDLRDAGNPISVVSEEHWVAACGRVPPM